MNSSSAAEPEAGVKRLDETTAGELFYNWPNWARSEQLPPPGDWVTWLLLGGRGSGKSRAGAEWVRAQATGAGPVSPIALVGETMTEAISIMVEGESGLMRIHPPGGAPRLRGNHLTWPNGAEAMVLSASDPDRFRGPEFAAAWCDELGCPAVDKGANQPNVFPDPKSSENARPYFSNGAPDALAQRQFLRAHAGWWRPDAPGFLDAHNPASTVYGGRMVDPERIYLWTWDARPYPAFPTDTDVWADGPNYAAGHWLTGRLGALATDELIEAVAADYGFALDVADAAPPLVFGLDLEGVVSARDALQPVVDASGLAVSDGPDGLAFGLAKPRLTTTVDAGDLVDAGSSVSSRTRPDPSAAIGRVAYSYTDRERDYLDGTLTAMRLSGGATSTQNSPLVLDLAGARGSAERLLAAGAADLDTLAVTLPPSLVALEVGDVVAFSNESDGPFVVTELRDSASRQAALQAIVPTSNAAIVADRPLPIAGGAAPRALPLPAAVHLPADPLSFGPSRLLLAASSSPWPGSVEITDDASGAALATLTRCAVVGELLSAIGAGPTALWDDATVLTVELYSGHLASVDDLAALGGANRLAVETDSGGWEVIGFATATLTAPSTYALTHLLRGQGGTGPAIGPASAGNRVVVLDNAPVADAVPVDWLGNTVTLRAYAGRTDPVGATFSAVIDLAPELPLPPVHLSALRDPASGDIALGWARAAAAATPTAGTSSRRRSTLRPRPMC